MSESGRWLSRLWWGEPVYTHGVLLNWLMALSFKIFGVGASAARLPSAIACITAVLLTYDISKIITGKRYLGFLSAALLMLFHLWFQFGHLATQDMLLVCLELLAIWGLLKAEAHPEQRGGWGFLSGIVLGLGFLTKSFMILLPAAAIFPYLIFQQRRHHHLTNPGLYLGLATGIGIVGLWLWASIAQYGDVVMASLFGKISELGTEAFHPDAGPLYYFWNIPANAFPWPLFSVIGAWFCWRDGLRLRSGHGQGLRSGHGQGLRSGHGREPYRWLLIYPFILFGLLTSFSTRTPYYTLQLFPFMALFGAIALHRLATQPAKWPRRWLSIAFAALGLILAVLGSAILLTPLSASTYLTDFLTEAKPYAPVAVVLGAGWCALPFTLTNPGTWLAAWMLPTWLALGATGISGLLGDYSPELMTDLAQPSVESAIAQQSVTFITGTDWSNTDSHKTLVLLSFYTPQLGKLNPPLDDMESGTYAWLAPNADFEALEGAGDVSPIAQVQQWQLIKFETALNENAVSRAAQP